MKKILLLAALLAAPTNLIAGTYDKDIQIAAGGVSVDSVRLRVEVDNTQIDSALWASFPVDSFITLPDTAIVTLSYWYYFTDDNAEAIPYTTASEQIDAANRTQSVYDNVFGWYTVDTISGDSIPGVSVTVKDASSNPWDVFKTDASGFNSANLSTGDWTFIASRAGDSYRDTTISITTDDTILIRGGIGSVGSPAGGNEVRIYGYAYDILDTADAMANVWVFIEPTAQANNTCDSTITPRFMKRKLTEADGLFEFDVVRSSCLSDTEYRIWLKWEGGQTDKHEFVAPDAANFRILW